MPRSKDAAPEDTIERIRAAAAEALAEASPRDAISIRDVAKRANISTGTLTYYFPNKELLIEDIITGHIQRLERALTELALGSQRIPGHEHFLREMVRTMYRFTQRERVFLELRSILEAKKTELGMRLRNSAHTHIETAAKVLESRVDLELQELTGAIWASQAWISKLATLREVDVARFFGEGAQGEREELVIQLAVRMLHPRPE